VSDRSSEVTGPTAFTAGRRFSARAITATTTSARLRLRPAAGELTGKD
jgi:hypothetical protein